MTEAIVAGVDVGSLYTKVVLLQVGQETGKSKIVSHFTNRSGAFYKKAANVALQETVKSIGLEEKDLSFVVSTGYGRYLVPFGEKQVSEISCHAMGVHFVFPEAHTLIDIGGQDSRAIRIDDSGGVRDFMMNDKCAAGTGRFLEVMAEALEIKLTDMGQQSLLSRKELNVSSICTVFAESEVISYLSEGIDRADIIAGIHRAISARVAALVTRIGLKERVAMSGGTAKNPGLVSALEQKLGTKLLIAEEPQVMGALGAALFAAREYKKRSAENRPQAVNDIKK